MDSTDIQMAAATVEETLATTIQEEELLKQKLALDSMKAAREKPEKKSKHRDSLSDSQANGTETDPNDDRSSVKSLAGSSPETVRSDELPDGGSLGDVDSTGAESRAPTAASGYANSGDTVPISDMSNAVGVSPVGEMLENADEQKGIIEYVSTEGINPTVTDYNAVDDESETVLGDILPEINAQKNDGLTDEQKVAQAQANYLLPTAFQSYKKGSQEALGDSEAESEAESTNFEHCKCDDIKKDPKMKTKVCTLL